MNINVSSLKGEYDNFDPGDKREDVVLDKIPVFMSMSLDRSLLRTVNSFPGGKGTVQYRRALGPAVFATSWAFVDHVLVPSGASIGSHSYRGLAQFYCVMSGKGVVSISTCGQQESASIHDGTKGTHSSARTFLRCLLSQTGPLTGASPVGAKRGHNALAKRDGRRKMASEHATTSVPKGI